MVTPVDLAHAIWTTSRGEVNPRHIAGHWLLSQKYELLVDGSDGRPGPDGPRP